MATQKTYPIDTDGTDVMSSLLTNLVNTFPGLSSREQIKFATLDKGTGIALYPSGGAAILEEKKFITGNVKQTCQYQFIIIHRSSPRNDIERLRIKELLDALGKWLSRQPIKVKGKTYQLTDYPKCQTDNRVIKSIDFVQPAFIVENELNSSEAWEISCKVNYDNEFYI